MPPHVIHLDLNMYISLKLNLFEAPHAQRLDRVGMMSSAYSIQRWNSCLMCKQDSCCQYWRESVVLESQCQIHR